MSSHPSRLGVNIGLFLGVSATAWTAVVSIACVPWFLNLLGIESYGLIGFFATLQVAIGLLDLGLGATINREVARSAVLDNLESARRLLSSLEFVYAAVALLILVGITAAAPLIADKWLRYSTLDRDDIHLAIQLMGVVAALRWPISLYLGTLVGLQRMQVSYRITATMATIGNVGAVLVLLYIERTIWAYFVWQATASLLYLLWGRRSAWRELGERTGTRFDSTLLRGVLVQSVMMSGVAVSGLILTQLDKFMVSSSTTLSDFGRYSLAVIMTSGLSVIIIPTFNLIYPRLSTLVATGDTVEQIRFYRLGTRLFLSCLFPVALSAFFYAGDVLTLWTGDRALARDTAPIAGLLCLGVALNGMMHFPYAMQLATGRTRLPLLINCALIVIVIPLTFVLVRHYGALGGALAVLCLNAIYVVIGVTATHIYLLPGLQKRWLLHDVAPTLIVAAATVTGGNYLASLANLDHLARLAVGTVCSVVATTVLFFLYRDVRSVVKYVWSTSSMKFRRRGSS